MQQSRTVRAALVRMLLVVPLAAIGGGCGGKPSDMPELGEVTGVVTVDDKPAGDLRVTFDPKKTRSSLGVTDKDGRYDLLFKSGVPGAAVGSHTVKISKVFAAEKADQPDLPKQYNDESILQADVKKGKNEFNFNLKSK